METECCNGTRKARRIYASRRDLLAEEASRHLGDDVMFDLPAGGLALWLRLRNGLSGETWAANAASAGLAITPGIRFALDPANAPEAFRFGYARHESRTSAHRSTAFAHAAEPIAVQLGREKNPVSLSRRFLGIFVTARICSAALRYSFDLGPLPQ